ncbi:MAG: hypothetical protein D6797_07720 [Bdellovibrio sp.]|nr:MAG: hypothetical protein D6797_07720 [Bdellovibrio sp.]
MSCKRILLTFFATIGLAHLAYANSLHFGGFSELTLQATDTKTSNSNTFSQGGIDLFLTKNLDERTNILSEIVYEISDANEAVLDVERIWIQYEISNWFKVKAGRVHTALGYWNQTFHHGRWLQTSISRPLLFNFEDDDGILPVHSIGFEIRGSSNTSSSQSNTFGYVIDIGNGRGENPDPPQTGHDADQSKAVNTLLYYEIKNLGLRIGGVFLTDDVAATSNFTDSNGTSVNRAPFKESITGFHLVWNYQNTQLLFENFSIHHDYDENQLTALNEKDNTINAFYVLLNHKFNKWTPYVKYDSIKGDPDYSDAYLNQGVTTDKNVQKTNLSLGVRYDLTYTSAIKLEFSNYKVDSNGTETTNEKVFAFNWSYAW